jgi:hypothetical protein
MRRSVVLDVVGLTADLLGGATPNLNAIMRSATRPDRGIEKA